MRRPRPLARGARIALVAPAGPLRGPDDLHTAEANVRALGYEPVVAAHALARAGYLAGDDATRAADLDAALADPTIAAVWCLRGGYGAMRIIEGIDWARWARDEKTLIGYSDITAFHAALSRAGLVGYHGPTARGRLTPFTRDSLARALAGEDSAGHVPEARVIAAGRARGPLVGGNLSLLAALCGTPYEPAYDGAIVVIEDVGEPVYRVDRMLAQLRLGGRLARCAALVVGAFTEIPRDASDDRADARSLDDVIGETARAMRVPCLAGVPVGHIADQWTLPLGAMAELDAGTQTLRIL